MRMGPVRNDWLVIDLTKVSSRDKLHTLYEKHIMTNVKMEFPPQGWHSIAVFPVSLRTDSKHGVLRKPHAPTYVNQQSHERPRTWSERRSCSLEAPTDTSHSYQCVHDSPTATRACTVGTLYCIGVHWPLPRPELSRDWTQSRFKNPSQQHTALTTYIGIFQVVCIQFMRFPHVPDFSWYV